MILDEFARLENLPAVSNALWFCRRVQSPALAVPAEHGAASETSTAKNGRRILANCGMMQFFTPADVETAEYLQRRGGMTTGQSRSRSYYGSFWRREQSESRSENRVPLLPFERMMSMSPQQSVVFFAGTMIR